MREMLFFWVKTFLQDAAGRNNAGEKQSRFACMDVFSTPEMGTEEIIELNFQLKQINVS